MNSEDDERESEQSLLRASGTHSHPRHVSHPLYHFEHIDNLSTVIIPPFHFPQKKKKRNATERRILSTLNVILFRESTGEQPGWGSFPPAGFPVSKEITRSEATRYTGEGKKGSIGHRGRWTRRWPASDHVLHMYTVETSLRGYK